MGLPFWGLSFTSAVGNLVTAGTCIFMTNIYVDNYLKIVENLVVNWQQYCYYSVSLLSF